MGTVLTEESQVECGHAGKLSMTGASRLTVNGKPVLTEDSVLAATISDCQKINTNAGEVRCFQVTLISSGKATKLSVGGKPVVLDALTGLTKGTPGGNIQVRDAKNDKLKAE